MSTYVPLASRASLAKALLLVACAIDCAAAFTSFGLLNLADEVEIGGFVTAELETAESRHALVRTLQLAAYAAAGAAFVRWFHRAYANLPAVGVERLRYRTGWAVGAWLVPIASLFWPKRIADEIWRGSDPEADGSARVTPVYGAWWRTFVVAVIFVLLGSAVWSVGQSPVDLELGALLQLVGNLLGVASAVLAYLVVDGTTERQHARAAKRLAASPAL